MGQDLLKSKFLGSMIGTGLGDALGRRHEGVSWSLPQESQVLALAQKLDLLIYTDDTHMMIGIAESLIEKNGFDGEHMAYRFMDNYEKEPRRGYAGGPRKIFKMINSGVPWDKAAEKLYNGGSFGNGSAMRIAPVGLLYHDDPVKLKDIAFKSSLITHAHELGKEGGALQAYAVAMAVNSDPCSVLREDDFLGKLFGFTQNEVYQQKLSFIKELLGTKDNKSLVIEKLGNGIEAFNSVPTAIYSFLSFPGSFEKAVSYAISLGGDADTIGAMTGAISGAFLGIEKIPKNLQEKLENREYIDNLAIRLWDLATTKKN